MQLRLPPALLALASLLLALLAVAAVALALRATHRAPQTQLALGVTVLLQGFNQGAYVLPAIANNAPGNAFADTNYLTVNHCQAVREAVEPFFNQDIF